MYWLNKCKTNLKPILLFNAHAPSAIMVTPYQTVLYPSLTRQCVWPYPYPGQPYQTAHCTQGQERSEEQTVEELQDDVAEESSSEREVEAM